MGCDIHFNVEKKINGAWQKQENPLRKCWACEGTGKNDQHEEPFEVHDYVYDKTKGEEIKTNSQILPAGTCSRCRGTGKAREEFYHDRNYQLFSILAGVRDYGSTKPIDEPRDVPTDSCAEIKEAYEDWGGDAHSATWYSLKELLDWNWDQPSGHVSGIVSLEQFKKYLVTKEPPDSYCQGVGGPNIVVADATWLAEQILHEESAKEKGLFLKDGVTYYARIRWGRTYRDMAYTQFLDVLQELKGIADTEKLPYEDMRMVMWFDN